MAGGPSTPELVNAVSFGVLAWGTCGVDQARDELGCVRAPFGINLFYPQAEAPAPEDLDTLLRITGAERLQEADLTAGFAEKFALALESPAAVISSTFGCFTAPEIAAIHESGAQAWVTVTNERDAAVARNRGADALVVQGPLAGGHRGTWTPFEQPDTRPLEELVAAIAPLGTPVIAAGGVRDARAVAALLELGAASVACGTAFLLADEAGTSERNRELLRSDAPSTASRAFSGRVARGIATDFTRANAGMPPVYPYLRPLTKGNDYCLVGADRGVLPQAPAAEIERALTP